MCRLLGGQRLLICTKASSLSSASTSSTSNNTSGAQLVIVKDHINFSGLGGLSALAGENDPRFGPRYFPLVEAYSPDWREATSSLATSLGFAVREGVSAEVGAPHEVTPTELVMLARMGATVMGKGSVAEVVTGLHAGMELQVLAFVENPSPPPARAGWATGWAKSEEREITRLLTALCGGKRGLSREES